MKKITLLSAAVLCIFAAFSCSKETDSPEFENPDIENPEIITTITASLPDTKTALGVKEGSSWPNYWSTGDQISVNGITSEALDSEANGKASASFIFAGDVQTPYYAAYPAAAVTAYSAGSATVTIPGTQNYVAGSYDPAAFIMGGSSDVVGTVNLNPFVSVFHLSLTGAGNINRIRLISPDDEPLSGSFTTDFSAKTAATTSSEVEMVAAEPVALDATTPVDFFICVPAGLHGAVKLEIYDAAGGSMKKKTTIASALAAGQMYWSTLAYTPSFVPKLYAEGITSSTAVICWDNAPVNAYTISVYSDSECASLVDSYAVSAGDACWSGNSPRFCISGLAANTTYYVKVIDTTNTAESKALAVTTAAFNIVEASSTPAAVDDVILAEDFSELRWDSDLIGMGVGYFATSQDSFANSEVLQFLPIDTNSEKVLGSQTTALGASRLAHWAQGANNNLYIHPGYIKLVGSKKVTHIVTPALDNIPEGKLATVEVEVTASPYFSESSASFCTTNAIVAVQTDALNELTDETKTNTLDLTTNKQDITLDAASAWKTYKVTLTDVVKGNRIAFGAADGVSGNDARMLLSDIKVTITALDDIPAPTLEASLKSVSSSTAAFTWTYGGDAADDIAKPYTASLYSDSACTNLVVSHDFEADASCWDGKRPCFSFGGLAPSTTYWLVVEDTENGTVADAVSATTEAFTPVDPTTVVDAGIGDVVLAEDFSEIGWGPDEFAVAAGIVPSPKNLDVLSGVNPTGAYTTYSNTGQRIFGTGVDLGDSRLSKGWGFVGNSAVYLRNAYLRITTTSSGARTHLVTPALSGIPAGKLATIDVTVTATKHETNENDVAVFVEKGLTINETTDPSNSSYKKYAGASLTDGAALGITKVKTWETKTVSISGVDADCQLVIGSFENIDTKNRFSITDVTVTITALEDDPVMKIKDDASFLAFVDAVAGGNKTLDAQVTSSFTVSAATAEAFSSIEDYEGTLNGNGKTITGLTKPLFNELKGTVNNLTLNSTINITIDQQDLGMFANVLSGTVDGCTSKGSVTFDFVGGINASTVEEGEHRIGGLIGIAASSGASIVDCTNEASVTNETTNIGDGELMVGGVLGTFWGTEFSISGCTNTGSVSNNANWSKTISVGGIIGQAGNGADSSCDLTVSDCTNEGPVSNNGNSDNNNCVGGIIGWIRFGTYSSNSNTGVILNSGSGNSNCVGGLFGYVDKSCTFLNHSNSGNVSNSGTSTSTGAYNGNNGISIGGVIGYMGSGCTISGYGDNAKYKFTNSGDISNSGDAKFVALGGILGRNTSGVFNMAGSSSMYSTNSGAITESSGNSKANGGAVCVGGIVGLTSTAIKPKYARNSGSILITGEKGTSDKATDIKVGGVGGWISNASLNFNNCRNTGNVTVSATITKGSLWAAGIVALTKDNTAVHYYWYSKANIDTHEATVQGNNFTAGLLGSYESTSAKSFTMYGHKVAGTVWGNKTTTGLFCCTRNSGSTFTFREPSSKPCTIAPGTVRKDDTNDDTVNTIDDVTIGILAGGSGSSSDVPTAIAEERIVVAAW